MRLERLHVRHQDLATARFDYLLASPAELRTLLRGTPWRLAHVEQTPDGAPYAAELRLGG